MKALLYKDFTQLRNFLLSGLFLIVFSLVGIWIFFNRLGEGAVPYGDFVCVATHWLTLIAAYFSFLRDEKNKWSVYMLSLPINKAILVRSRYVFLFSIFFVGNLVAILLSGFFYGFTLELFLGHSLIMTYTLLLLSVFLPFAYRMGSSDAVFTTVLLDIFFQLVVSIIIKLCQISLFFDTLFFHLTNFIYLFLSFLLFLVSYFLSCKALSVSDVH